MTFRDKINLLETRADEIGCSRRVLLPPLYRMQLAFGSEFPPPLFQGFGHNALVYGTGFGGIRPAERAGRRSIFLDPHSNELERVGRAAGAAEGPVFVTGVEFRESGGDGGHLGHGQVP